MNALEVERDDDELYEEWEAEQLELERGRDRDVTANSNF